MSEIAALEKSDYAVSTHRSHGHYVAKGGDLKAMLTTLKGAAVNWSTVDLQR